MSEEARDERESAEEITTAPTTKASERIVCPSGFVGVIRRLKIKELDALSSRSAIRAGTAMDRLFAQSWIETLELGPYREPFVDFPVGSNGPSVDWTKIFLGDRTHIMIELRKLILRDAFAFDITCAAPLCKRRIKWTVDLSKLERKEMSEETRDHLLDRGNEFVRMLPYSKKKISFKLLTGADERKIIDATKKEPDRLLSSTMLVRITGVENARTPSERRDFVEDMDVTDADWVQSEWEEADCGIRTDVEIECEHCGKIQRVELPFDADFFSRKSCPTKKDSEN